LWNCSSCSVLHPLFLCAVFSLVFFVQFSSPLIFVQCSSPLNLCVVFFTLYSLCIVLYPRVLCALFFTSYSLCSVLHPLFCVQCSSPPIVCSVLPPYSVCSFLHPYSVCSVLPPYSVCSVLHPLFCVHCSSPLYCSLLFRSYIALSDCSQLPTVHVLCSVLYDGFNSAISRMLHPRFSTCRRQNI
jgi:hypothetical protein